MGDLPEIRMVSNEFDTYLRLYDPSGVLVAVNDDSDGTNSFISERLCEPGLYTIEADSYRSSLSGVYTLSLASGGNSPAACAPPTTTAQPPANTTTTTTIITTKTAPAPRSIRRTTNITNTTINIDCI